MLYCYLLFRFRRVLSPPTNRSLPIERILSWVAIIALALSLLFLRDADWLLWIGLVAILAFEGIRLYKDSKSPANTEKWNGKPVSREQLEEAKAPREESPGMTIPEALNKTSGQ